MSEGNEGEATVACSCKWKAGLVQVAKQLLAGFAEVYTKAVHGG